MKTMNPEWVIDDMPDGEAALAKIERLGRIAYKSEDKIDQGERCYCVATRIAVVPVYSCKINVEAKPVPHLYRTPAVVGSCELCRGTGWVREPSSHKFVRMILKAEREARMVLMVEQMLDEGILDDQHPMYQEHRQAKARKIVQDICQHMKDNPAHESVIEHCSATVIFTSNRGFTHELVRHRLSAFTQESTRFCDYDKGKFGSEITVIRRELPSTVKAEDGWLAEWEQAMTDAEAHYKNLRRMGLPPELARDALNNATKATIGMTANFREWNHVFKMRCPSPAHPDMRGLMQPLRQEFRRRVPIVFDGAPE